MVLFVHLGGLLCSLQPPTYQVGPRFQVLVSRWEALASQVGLPVPASRCLRCYRYQKGLPLAVVLLPFRWPSPLDSRFGHLKARLGSFHSPLDGTFGLRRYLLQHLG